MLKDEYGVDYYNFESKYRKGIFYSKEYTTFVVKKEQYPEHLKEKIRLLLEENLSYMKALTKLQILLTILKRKANDYDSSYT